MPKASHGLCAGFLGPMPCARRQRSERRRARSRRPSWVNRACRLANFKASWPGTLGRLVRLESLKFDNYPWAGRLVAFEMRVWQVGFVIAVRRFHCAEKTVSHRFFDVANRITGQSMPRHGRGGEPIIGRIFNVHIYGYGDSSSDVPQSILAIIGGSFPISTMSSILPALKVPPVDSTMRAVASLHFSGRDSK
jgi:hypothetical protein